MSEKFVITRHLEIDAGHRVLDHGSKCKSVHGHRYKIEAVVEGTLAAAGQESGMVMDFGFLKDEMVKVIHDPFDHALVLWNKDPLVATLGFDDAYGEVIQVVGTSEAGKTVVIDSTPTAENLAAHWFHFLAPRIALRTESRARLLRLRVWETPNCVAEYPA